MLRVDTAGFCREEGRRRVRLAQANKMEVEMKKFFKTVFWLGLTALGALVAIQFQPVRQELKKLGLPL